MGHETGRTIRHEMRQGAIRIGVSGWTYAPWRGAFYPKGLVQKRELAHLASVFDTVEINGTFYGLQTPDAYARWAEQVPDGFVFAVKGSRFITHLLRLRDIEVPLANFLASGVLRLGAKLGPILWQFPPFFRFDPAVMDAFLALLPKDTEQAAALARRHDARLKARAWLAVDENRPLRHAVEIRHESFRDPAFTALLRRHGVALVCADTVEWPRLMDPTADFVYCRLHGSTELYRSGYEAEAIEVWGRRVEAWAAGRRMPDGEFVDAVETDPPPRDVYVYFDNTDKLRAPDDARALMRRVGTAAEARGLRVGQWAARRGRRGMECVVRGRAVPPELVGTFTDSTGLRRDPTALQQRMARDGYVFLRRALEPASVLAARRAVLARLVEVGEAVPGADAVATGGSRRREMHPDLGAFWQSVSEEPALRAVTHGAALGAILAALFGEPARAHDFLFLRAAPPGRATGLHFDAPFFTRATKRVATVWLSLGDTPARLGPLVVVEGSHRFDDLLAQIEGFDVARDTGRKATFGDDAVALAQERGTRLLTADFRAGDVLIFGMTLLHGSLDNHDGAGAMRLSCDVRWQPFSEPFDPRYMGPSPGGTTGAGYGELNGAKPLDQPWHVR